MVLVMMSKIDKRRKEIIMKAKMILLSFISILIVAISWLMNFGFMRLFCLMLLIPFVHALIVFAVCVVASNYSTYKKIRLYNYMFCITYMVSNILFPDADELSTRMFFGLIENDFMCNLGEVLSIISLIMHIVLIVLQFIEIRRIDKKINKNF